MILDIYGLTAILEQYYDSKITKKVCVEHGTLLL